MQHLKYIFLLFIVACSSSKIVYDYDTKEDFSAYKTFNFFSDVGNDLNEFDIKRIESSIEKQLRMQGLKRDSFPDFHINFFAKEHKEERRNTLGIGVGSGGFGISGGIPIGAKRINQVLTIDFVEFEKDQLYWQAVSESVLKEQAKPDERVKHYQKIIIEMLSGYPPKKEKSSKN